MMFSSCSKKDLENSLEKGVGMCLFNLPEVKESFGGPKCGNGFVEEGEECDCGEPEVGVTLSVLKEDQVHFGILHHIFIYFFQIFHCSTQMSK